MYTIRNISEKDISNIVKVYNSNKKFLNTHLGCSEIDENFIRTEIEQMKLLNFITAGIVDFESDEVVGIIDYKLGEVEAYLSIIMIDSSLQGRGLGKSLINHFESLMKAQKQKIIRIDVVNDYENNLVSYWKSLGFNTVKEIELEWANKKSKAVVMKKDID